MQQIGFIGLGSMGLPMARNLLRAGFSLKVYNRTASKSEELVKEGAKVASYPADLLSEGCSYIISMVSNDKALEEIVHGPRGIGPQLKEGCIHISMSTISPETSKRLDAFHRERGAQYVVATVSGRPEAAAAQKLWIYLAGEKKAKQQAETILKVLGQKVFDLGEDPSHGNTIKLCANFLLLAAIESLSETFAFAKKNGLSPQTIADIFGESLFACPVYQIYGKILSQEQFNPGLFLELGKKDIDLLRTTADASLVPMPLANLLHERLLRAMAHGREKLDWSAIALSSYEDAAIESSFLEKEKETVHAQ